MSFDPDSYGPFLAPLLRPAALAPLGPGESTKPVPPNLAAFEVEKAFAPHRVRDRQMADACQAGLWLLHNHLERSHEISQRIETPTGSYWHGLMHRREPDPDNAKYWFRRLGDHPVFPLLREAAEQLVAQNESPAETRFLVKQSAWDPFAFIDLCAACLARRSSASRLCEQIQQREWELLFDHCFRAAIT
jgi:hypothetical protein